MSDFQINDYLLSKECDDLAAAVVADFKEDLAADETLEDKRDEMMDRAHENTNKHTWVIYNYQSLMLCAHCDTENGEAFLDDVGFEWNQGESTIYTVAAAIAYGEMRARIEQEIDRLIEEATP